MKKQILKKASAALALVVSLTAFSGCTDALAVQERLLPAGNPAGA